MKLGLQLYSVRESMEKDFLGTLKKVKEMGYEGGELAGLYNNTPESVKNMFKEAGLVPISAHVTYQELAADIEGTVKKYKEIGCKYIAIPYLPEELRYGKEEYANVVANIKKIGEACNKNGIILLYHNHDFEFEKAENGEFVLDELYNEIPKALLQTEIDTCWVNVAGVNPCEYVEKYTNRAPVVHLKDFYGERNKKMYELIGIDGDDEKVVDTFEFRPLGCGKQNIQAIVDSAAKAGAEWIIAEQDQPSMGLSPLECVQKSMDFMKTVKY